MIASRPRNFPNTPNTIADLEKGNKMFIYVQHAFVVAQGANSQTKGFILSKEANLIDERVEFSMKFKSKLANKSTYVLDMVKNECVRNRYRYDPDNPVKDENVMQYIVKEYKDDIMRYLTSLKK